MKPEQLPLEANKARNYPFPEQYWRLSDQITRMQVRHKSEVAAIQASTSNLTKDQAAVIRAPMYAELDKDRLAIVSQLKEQAKILNTTIRTLSLGSESTNPYISAREQLAINILLARRVNGKGELPGIEVGVYRYHNGEGFHIASRNRIEIDFADAEGNVDEDARILLFLGKLANKTHKTDNSRFNSLEFGTALLSGISSHKEETKEDYISRRVYEIRDLGIISSIAAMEDRIEIQQTRDTLAYQVVEEWRERRIQGISIKQDNLRLGLIDRGSPSEMMEITFIVPDNKNIQIHINSPWSSYANSTEKVKKIKDKLRASRLRFDYYRNSAGSGKGQRK